MFRITIFSVLSLLIIFGCSEEEKIVKDVTENEPENNTSNNGSNVPSDCQIDSDCIELMDPFFSDGQGSDTPKCIITSLPEGGQYGYCSECESNNDCGDFVCYSEEYCR